mmetsp:Transcript_23238/g.80962  ORF Transcript_23238/g.80962 Transcript_23238/m.80962 type:complete len:222 (+) Transcript_23238:8460-9125(+)
MPPGPVMPESVGTVSSSAAYASTSPSHLSTPQRPPLTGSSGGMMASAVVASSFRSITGSRVMPSQSMPTEKLPARTSSGVSTTSTSLHSADSASSSIWPPPVSTVTSESYSDVAGGCRRAYSASSPSASLRSSARPSPRAIDSIGMSRSCGATTSLSPSGGVFSVVSVGDTSNTALAPHSCAFCAFFVMSQSRPVQLENVFLNTLHCTSAQNESPSAGTAL